VAEQTAERLPEALTAMGGAGVAGGAGPRTALGRVALGAGTGAAAAAAAPGTPQERLKRAETGALIGGGLGAAGEVAGRAAAPRMTPDATTLAARHVPLTPGMAAGRGSVTAEAEDRATSLPVAGQFIQDRRQHTLDGFARATVNQALEHVGAGVPENATPRQAVTLMDDTISNRYKQIFRGVPTLSADQPMLGDLAQIELDMTGGRRGGRPYVSNIVRDEWNHAFRNVQRTGPMVGPRGSTLRLPSSMTGEQAWQAASDLGQKGRALMTDQDSFRRQAGQLLLNAREAMIDAIERQYPHLAQDLQNTNRAYALSVRIGNAATRRATSQGRFTPSDLLHASRGDSRGVRRSEFRHGDALLQDWGETAQRVLPSSLGESGTTARAHLLNPVAWGAGLAGRPIYRALSNPARFTPGSPTRTFGENISGGLRAATPGIAAAATSPSRRLAAQQKVTRIQQDLVKARNRNDLEATRRLMQQLQDADADYRRLRAPTQ
jgi:hypothetical protein